MTPGGQRVPPWSAWVSNQPTIVLHATCHPDQAFDAVVTAARGRRWRVTVPGPHRVALTRGLRGGGAVAEVLQLGLVLPIHRVEVEVSLSAPRAPGTCAVLVTCTVGAREPRVATSVARTLDDAVGRLTSTGVEVDVAGWYAHPSEVTAEPEQ